MTILRTTSTKQVNDDIEMAEHAKALEATSYVTFPPDDEHTSIALLDVLQTLSASSDIAANVASALVRDEQRFHEQRSLLEHATICHSCC